MRINSLVTTFIIFNGAAISYVLNRIYFGFLGWYDVALSKKGVEEAAEGGHILNDAGFKFDVAFTSYLKRAIRTCDFVLDATDCLW